MATFTVRFWLKPRKSHASCSITSIFWGNQSCAAAIKATGLPSLLDVVRREEPSGRGRERSHPKKGNITVRLESAKGKAADTGDGQDCAEYLQDHAKSPVILLSTALPKVGRHSYPSHRDCRILRFPFPQRGNAGSPLTLLARRTSLSSTTVTIGNGVRSLGFRFHDQPF